MLIDAKYESTDTGICTVKSTAEVPVHLTPVCLFPVFISLFPQGAVNSRYWMGSLEKKKMQCFGR